MFVFCFLFFKQKTAYEMRISDWSSDVCSSDLTLENVIQARNMAMTAQGPHDQAEAENVISGALKSVFALSEAYPDLKANTNFLNLQEELSGTEGRIAYADRKSTRLNSSH